MNIPLIDLKAQHEVIKEEIMDAIKEVIESGSFILGQNVKALEKEIAEFTNTKYGIGVGNGTDGLQLILEAYGIGEGDEVITTPFTFFATAEAISQTKAVPVFVDIDKDSYNIDVNKIEEKITNKTKAIIPVHIFGQPADMDKILEIGKHYKIIVIEDACQAIGADYKGKKIGSLGNAACFSFYPTKNLGGIGDGGMIVTNDELVAERIKMLRFHGQRKKYYSEILGHNSRLDEVHAAILRIKLKYLKEWNEKRSQFAYRYTKKLKDFPLKTPIELANIYSVYHLYVALAEERDELVKYLHCNGIACGIYYPVPLHLQKAYKSLNYNKGDFPISEYVSKRAIALPLYPEMTEEIQDYIIEKIKDFYLGR